MVDVEDVVASVVPFLADDAAELVRLVAGRKLSLPVRDAISTRSGGNPLFLIELAKLAGANVITGIEETPAAKPVRVLGLEPSLGAAPLMLRLSRPMASDGRVEVHDATGRVVRTLRAAQGPNVAWDGRDESGAAVSAGIYLFRVTDAGRTHTAKAILTD